MSINGRVGRARWAARRRRELAEEAAALGANYSTRAARSAFEAARSRALCVGLRDRLRCGCSGNNEEVTRERN